MGKQQNLHHDVGYQKRRNKVQLIPRLKAGVFEAMILSDIISFHSAIYDPFKTL